MSVPYFFHQDIPAAGSTLILEEDSSKHIISVLRMQVGERMLLTNGQGTKALATISADHRKRCEVRIDKLDQEPAPTPRLVLAVSPLKNASRYEWLLEKATELGVHAIVPLVCQRTEKTHLRKDRLQGILTSAMLQSQQCWLPEFPDPISFADYLTQASMTNAAKLIAHCEPGDKKVLHDLLPERNTDRIILIGPEGDFTSQEIEAALAASFLPVSLGSTRLRTETAALFASSLLRP